MNKRLLQDILGLGNKTHQFKEVLLYVAYTFASGPFQHLWFRYGYNPILDPTSRIYQQFIYKIHPKFLQDISDRYDDDLILKLALALNLILSPNSLSLIL